PRRAAQGRGRALWEQNAKLYICGSRAIGEGVKTEVVKMVINGKKERGDEDASEESVKEWWEGLRNVRYATDVFD
ncbi:hypothetical protein EKO27_g11681, partial [Xylaria grammica]